MDPYILRQYRFDQGGNLPFKRLNVRSASNGNVPVQFLTERSDAANKERHDVAGCVSTTVDEQQRCELHRLVPPDVGQRLMLLYSQYIMPQFPVICLRPDENAANVAPGILAAIYVAASPFATFDEELCIQTVYETPPLGQLRDFIWKSLQEHRDRPTLASLQSALLLALLPPTDTLNPETDERALLAAMIVAMANALGLQHDPTSWNLPEDEKVSRRRLSCLVKANDTWTAMVAGRPPLISHDNWVLEIVSTDQVRTTVSEGMDFGPFIQYIQLTRILSRVLREVLYVISSRCSSVFGTSPQLTGRSS